MIDRERQRLNRILKRYGLRLCTICPVPQPLEDFHDGERRCKRCVSILNRVRLVTDEAYRGYHIEASRKHYASSKQVYHCPRCGQPMRVYPLCNEPGAVLLADCWTPGCDLYSVTLKAGQHDRLTDAQIARYAQVTQFAQALTARTGI